MKDKEKKKKNVERMKKKFMRLLEKKKVLVKDISEVDFEALYDSSLTYRENWNNISAKYEISDAKYEEYKEKEIEEIKKVEEQAKQDFLESIKNLQDIESEQYFKELKDYVGVVKEDNEINALIVVGRGGMGKTYTVLSELNRIKADFEYLNSYSTPLDFYHILHENNGKMLVLDDFEGILNNDISLSILKSALWGVNNRRFICYSTTSDKLKYPKKFEFTGKIILCLNTINSEESEEVKALISRTLYYRLDFDYETTCKILMLLVRNDKASRLSKEERVEVVNFIIENTTEAVDLNFRILPKFYAIYEYCKATGQNWRELAQKQIIIDEDKQVLLDVEKRSCSREEKAKEFSRLTGLSRRTYFNWLKRMGLKGAVSASSAE